MLLDYLKSNPIFANDMELWFDHALIMEKQVHLAFDTRTETSKGFAYVQYADADAAVEAYRSLDGKHFQGRLLHVLPASAKKTYKIDEFELSKLPMKKQNQIKRKMEATSSTFSWNSLYMNVSCILIETFFISNFLSV